MMMMRNNSPHPTVIAEVTQTAMIYKIFQTPKRKGNDKIVYITIFKHREDS